MALKRNSTDFDTPDSEPYDLIYEYEFTVDGIYYGVPTNHSNPMIRLYHDGDRMGAVYNFSEDFELDEDAWLKWGIVRNKLDPWWRIGF